MRRITLFKRQASSQRLEASSEKVNNSPLKSRRHMPGALPRDRPVLLSRLDNTRDPAGLLVLQSNRCRCPPRRESRARAASPPPRPAGRPTSRRRTASRRFAANAYGGAARLLLPGEACDPPCASGCDKPPLACGKPTSPSQESKGARAPDTGSAEAEAGLAET